jgi:hypothetical protein
MLWYPTIVDKAGCFQTNIRKIIYMEEINYNPDEEITLFTDEEQVSVKKINQEFTQQSHLKGLLYRFTIFNDIQCYQHIQRKHGGKQKFRINLTYLDPRPVHRSHLAESWLISSAIFAIISLMLIYVNWFKGTTTTSSLAITLTILAVTLCLTSFLFGLFKAENRVYFYSQYGRAAILELINNNPDKASFDDFMQSLSSHIISAQNQARLDSTERLTQELKELRRLKDETVISEQKYEQAKQRIFRNKAFKS